MSLLGDVVDENTPINGAVLQGSYRYALYRYWDRDAPHCTFVMLNPSSADAENDDPTIRKCRGFASYIAAACLHPETALVVAAWGNPPPSSPDDRRRIAARVAKVHELRGVELRCLGKTRKGYPRHPVRLPYDTPLEVFWG